MWAIVGPTNAYTFYPVLKKLGYNGKPSLSVKYYSPGELESRCFKRKVSMLNGTFLQREKISVRCDSVISRFRCTWMWKSASADASLFMCFVRDSPQYSAMLELSFVLCKDIGLSGHLRQRQWAAVTAPGCPLEQDSLFITMMNNTHCHWTLIWASLMYLTYSQPMYSVFLPALPVSVDLRL